MITLKNLHQIDKMRSAGHLLFDVLSALMERVVPGISTKALDAYAEEMIRKHNAIPSFKGYNGFSGSICASIDEQVVHGIPNEKTILKEGSILSIDCGVILDGWQSDSARTVAVGNISAEKQKLIKDCERSFFLGAMMARADNRVGDIGHAVQSYCEERGYGVIRDLTGHGIGRNLHEDPSIPNYGSAGHGLRLKAGMTIAVEPMVALGTWQVQQLSDGWTIVTKDRKPCSHYEHTLLINEGEPELLSYPGFDWEKYKESVVDGI